MDETQQINAFLEASDRVEKVIMQLEASGTTPELMAKLHMAIGAAADIAVPTDREKNKRELIEMWRGVENRTVPR